MPDIKASIEYLAPLTLYETEKPYLALLPPSEGYDPDTQRTDNLEYELHEDMLVTDIRGRNEEFRLEDCGFQVLSHHTKLKAVESMKDVELYKRETEEMLRKNLGVLHVTCYDVKVPFLQCPRSRKAGSNVVLGEKECQV